MHRSQFTPDAPGTLVSTPFGCESFVPEPLPSEVPFDPKLVRANDTAVLALGELRGLIAVLPNPTLLTSPFLRREAVLSSRIEGTETEIEGLYLFETTASTRGRKTGGSANVPDDAPEVHNYVVALEQGLQLLPSLPICNRMLKDLHRTLMDGVLDERGRDKLPGRFRRAQAYIGSGSLETARYVAPPFQKVEELMVDLELFINRNDSHPALVRTALAHYQFEAIHPFTDGNGRLGRLLILLMLASSGLLPQPLLYLSAYFERRRSDYTNHLWQVSRAGDWNGWIGFFLDGVRVEAEDACLRARSILALRDEFRLLAQREAPPAALTLVDRLFEWPVLTGKSAREVLQMSAAGSAKNLHRLEELQIVSEVTGFGRNRVYVAKRLMELLRR